MKIVELFSGIGSQAKALKNIGITHEVLATCEWNIHAFCAYAAIYTECSMTHEIESMDKKQLVEKLKLYGLSTDGKELMADKTLKNYSIESLKFIYTSILNTKNKVNIQKLKGNEIEGDIDIMTYSFPCQDLSNVGAFHGYKKGIDRDSNSRSSLLWEVERILSERIDSNLNLPKFMILENVPALLSKRHQANFNEWKGVLKNHGYHNKVYKLNAIDFGIPQNRNRLIMISTLTNDKEKNEKLDLYYENHNLEDAHYRESLEIERRTLNKYLKTDYSNEKYKIEARECQPNDTVSRRRIWEDNPKLVLQNKEIALEKVATLTTKQDRHPNSGNIYFDYEGNKKSKFRYLTPRECFMLMGFEEKDFEKVINKNINCNLRNKIFTRDNLIKMAGNSIVVNVLEEIFRQVLEIKEIINCGEEDIWINTK